jgi:hypothetical protein
VVEIVDRLSASGVSAPANAQLWRRVHRAHRFLGLLIRCGVMKPSSEMLMSKTTLRIEDSFHD